MSFIIRKSIGTMDSELIQLSADHAPDGYVTFSSTKPARIYVAREGVEAAGLDEAMRTGAAICVNTWADKVNVLFFDVDGCGCAYPEGQGGQAREFTPTCARLLRDLAERRPRVRLVIISDRRLSPETYADLKRMLVSAHLPFEIMGCTPDLRDDGLPAYSRRPREIAAWWSEWGWSVVNSAILDDAFFGYEDVDGLPPLWSPDPAVGICAKITHDLIHHFSDANHSGPHLPR